MRKACEGLGTQFPVFIFTRSPSCKPINNEPYKNTTIIITRKRFRKIIIKSDMLMCCINIEDFPNFYNDVKKLGCLGFEVCSCGVVN